MFCCKYKYIHSAVNILVESFSLLSLNSFVIPELSRWLYLSDSDGGEGDPETFGGKGEPDRVQFNPKWG